jgi:ABC-type multidrug transport system fused ATPase/permease subunit
MNPSKFSLAYFAILQQSSSTLGYALERVLSRTKSLTQQVVQLKHLYEISEVQTKLQEGDLSYPLSDSEDSGMAFELQGISFAYPGATKTTNALDNVSLSIKAGQLVVIVGANGSGKSTLIKLLSRFYDPSEGLLLIDGTPAAKYRSSDLRQATASFTQDHNLYPLSLYENIGLGYPERLSDAMLVAQASEQGGASGFIAKLADGLHTVLEPNEYPYSINVPSDEQHPLREKINMLQKELDISGGERQRVIAARTFMQLNSGKVKFVAVDEPSSALDAEAEAQLFDRLLGNRQGKTMVFVTHRFGHLTKFADNILCMKDGKIAESGTHHELMQLEGEYAKLYNIQAEAYTVNATCQCAHSSKV